MELIQLLTQNLGVEEKQAKGGAGLLFQLAQQQLSDGDFSKVAKFVPGVGDLIKEAPQADGAGGGIADALGGLAASAMGGNQTSQGGGIVGALGGLAASAMGDQGGKLGNIASLIGGFSQLGIDLETATQFVPIVLDFVQNQGGDEIKEILAGVLKQ